MKKLNHNKLAEGEMTGHSHRALSADVELFDLENGQYEMHAPNGTDIEHEEHNLLQVPTGEYIREIAKEFDPFEEKMRELRD